MAQASASQIFKNFLLMMAGGGLGAVGGAGGGIGGGGIGAMLTGGIGDPAEGFVANMYPRQFAPAPYHNFNVLWVDSKEANNNQHGQANMETINEAGRMQTLDEHNRAIRQFLRPGMTPQEQRAAINMGLEAEKRLPQYWNESKDRRPFSVSSSAVSGIRLTPDGRIEVQWHSSPTWYTFKQYPDTYQASLAAQELLKSDSIGRAVMPYQRHGKELVFKNKQYEYSKWNRPNYDSSMAKG